MQQVMVITIICHVMTQKSAVLNTVTNLGSGSVRHVTFFKSNSCRPDSSTGRTVCLRCINLLIKLEWRIAQKEGPHKKTKHTTITSCILNFIQHYFVEINSIVDELLGAISVDFNGTAQLLIVYSALIKKKMEYRGVLQLFIDINKICFQFSYR
jgi:hypothetical protein